MSPDDPDQGIPADEPAAGTPSEAAYADEPDYWVRTESSGNEARVDIEIAARGKFIIYVENKTYAVEGDDQTNREWRSLVLIVPRVKPRREL